MRATINPLRIFILSAILLAGCDKKPSANPVDSGGTESPGVAGASISGVQRYRVIRSLQSYMDSVTRVSPSGVSSAVLKFFKSRPEFQHSGIKSDSSVFGVFTDGRVIIYARNVPYDASVPIPPLSPGTSYNDSDLKKGSSTLPGSSKAYFMDTSEPSLLDPSYIAASTRWLNTTLNRIIKATPYTPNSSTATIANLKLVKDAGLFHIASHGGLGDLADRTTETYSIMTSEVCNDGKDTVEYKDDWAANRLTYFAATNLDEKGNPIFYMNYGITPAFVAKYMTFADNSLVVITACTSYNTPMLNAFKQAGASVYIGWDNTVRSDVSDPAAAFIFDRCLGTSLVKPNPVPPQRPFPWQFVINDLAYRGYTVSNGTAVANLKFSQLKGDLTVLLPSILWASFTNYGTYLKFNVEGDWGTVPGRLLLNGIPLSLSKAWKEKSIETDMPLVGGNIQVDVNGMKSNVVQLTQWSGTVTYTETGAGTLKKKMIANISFLADVHKYRRLSGANSIYKDEAVFGAARIVAPFPTITCTYECSGSYEDVFWTGSGTISNIGPAPGVDIPGGFLMGTIGDEGQTTLIDFVATAYYTVKKGTSSSQQKLSTSDGGFTTLTFPIGPGFLLKAGRVVKQTSSGSYTMEWSDFKPSFLPDPNAAR